MQVVKLFSPRLIFALFIGVSVLVGWYIPAFYAWTGSDQSRPSPLIGQFALGITLAGLAVVLLLPLLPIKERPTENASWSRPRFNLRTMLAMTAVVAIVFAGLMKFPLPVSTGLGLIAFGFLGFFGIRNRQYRLPAITLLACMILPYVWVIGYGELDRLLPALFWMILGFPAFLPAAITGGLVGVHFNESAWLSILLTAVEIIAGVWTIRLGPKRTIAFLVVALLSSTFGSFVFYQLCIM